MCLIDIQFQDFEIVLSSDIAVLSKLFALKVSCERQGPAPRKAWYIHWRIVFDLLKYTKLVF